MEAFDIFGQGGDLESNEDLSWEDFLEEFQSWSRREIDSQC